MDYNDINVIVREMTSYDIEGVHRVEEASFSEPWTKSSFEFSIEADYDYCIVATVCDNICGFLIMRVSLDCGDIADVAVSEAFRNRGIGEMLMKNAIEYGRQQSITQYMLEVRASNAPAIRLYEKSGFKVIGSRGKYYSNPVEDALVMMLGWNFGDI